MGGVVDFTVNVKRPINAEAISLNRIVQQGGYDLKLSPKVFFTKVQMEGIMRGKNNNEKI